MMQILKFRLQSHLGTYEGGGQLFCHSSFFKWRGWGSEGGGIIALIYSNVIEEQLHYNYKWKFKRKKKK